MILLTRNTTKFIRQIVQVGTDLLACVGATGSILNLICRCNERKQNSDLQAPLGTENSDVKPSDPKGASTHPQGPRVPRIGLQRLANAKNLKYSFIIPFLFNKLGNEIPADVEPIITYSFNMFILSLIVLVCLINITGYFISIYLINKYDVEKRYSKYVKLIRYFEKSQIFFVIIEIIICFSCLILIVITNFGLLSVFIYKII